MSPAVLAIAALAVPRLVVGPAAATSVHCGALPGHHAHAHPAVIMVGLAPARRVAAALAVPRSGPMVRAGVMHRHPPPAPGLALLSARSALVGVLHNHTLLTHADLAACCDALSAVNAALGRPCGAVHKRLSSQIAIDRRNGLLPGRSW